MRIFFDSSVLVAVFYADHQHHAASAKLFLATGKDDLCALRTLGEVYATLTGLVKQIRERLSLVSLTEQEYASALDSAASAGVVGAAFYDMLIARCAVKAKADVLLTWNTRDFVRLGPEIQRIVKTPLEI